MRLCYDVTEHEVERAKSQLKASFLMGLDGYACSLSSARVLAADPLRCLAPPLWSRTLADS